MKQEKISTLQLFYVIVGFEVGNTMILPFGAGAKQDAWLAIALGMISGIFLMLLYSKISAYYPGDTLIQMVPKIIGKYLAFPINLFYIFYFVFLASTACRNFGELIISTILTKTPFVVIIGSFMVLVIYCLRGGVEPFGRMGELIFPVYIIAIVLVWILLFSVEHFNLNNLTPVVGNGVKPIVKEAFPNTLISFGETIIILMFCPVLNNSHHSRKIGISVIVIGGMLLMFNAMMNISVLGPEIYSLVKFPLLETTRQVSIADFLERFDALVILLMVSGVFFKIGGWTYGAAIGIAHLFHLKDHRSILVALGTIIVPLSLLHASSDVEHFYVVGRVFLNMYFHILMQIVFPLILFFIAFIRKRLNSVNFTA
ncbi:endospore germination permease [Neobacillus sp. 3P2-tot-E-2]|uniref:GerAB/ArcD/ProY family transporter n=1 Tax=Neobacillus sp. 3P2-tot-E-2 TaxID=3132212 RepID=UPI0039A2A79B